MALMSKSQLAITIAAATRFTKLAEALKIRLDDEALQASLEGKSESDIIWGNALSGSVRRASMDLTRELAALRQI